VEFEDIQEMRRKEGISDVELRQTIRKLVIGDFVKVTLLTSPKSFQTLLVRITSIRGSTFRGTLAHKPDSFGLAQVPVGVSIPFTTAHIHSAERAPVFKKLSNQLVAIQPPSKPLSVSAKPKRRSRLAPARPAAQALPLTTAERLRLIEALGQRVNEYVQFMCQAGNPNNASAEATERAVLAFHEELVLLEGRLGRIHSDFKLE
jgi:hypothetical protein